MPKIIELESYSDARGSLVAVESAKNIPFEIKRIYYIFANKPNLERGQHAHKNLKQIYIAVSGSCKVAFDDGKNKSEFVLNDPRKGLVIDEIIWREIKEISADCVMLVIASDFYNEDDYIRNHDDFVKYISKKS